jgi:predicted lipoprotein
MVKAVAVRRVILAVVTVGVIAAVASTTRYVSADEDIPVSNAVGQGIDPKSWAQDNYASQVVPAIESNAQPWADLVAAITADPDAAGAKYGKKAEGANSYSYAVTITGTLAEGQFGELAIQAEGTPAAVTVGFQVGPAIVGSALRDASGLLTFGMFTNQTDYQQAGEALNTMVKQQVLASFDKTTAVGGTFTIVGAFTWTGDGHASITPISIKAGS